MFGLFGKDKVTPAKIDKQIAKVKERYSKPEFRREAMDKLIRWGTAESLSGVLQRFNVVAQSPHYDEQEKQWLSQAFTTLGQEGKAALVKHLNKENSVIYVIQALEGMLETSELHDIVVTALTGREPEDHRSVQAKQELVAWLGQHADDTRLPTVAPYLFDHADDVQCTTIDVVEARRVDAAYGNLLQLISSDTESPRVIRRAATAISQLEIALEETDSLAAEVLEDFELKNGKLTKHAA